MNLIFRIAPDFYQNRRTSDLMNQPGAMLGQTKLLTIIVHVGDWR